MSLEDFVLRMGVSVGIPLGSGDTEPVPTSDVSRDLADAHPVLRERYEALKADYAAQTGKRLVETCTYRSVKEQAKLYTIGRRNVQGERPVTNCDGTTNKSRHNVFPAEAVDVAVIEPGSKVVSWTPSDYDVLGPLAEKHSLIWGGKWKLLDRPHLELPAQDA